MSLHLRAVKAVIESNFLEPVDGAFKLTTISAIYSFLCLRCRRPISTVARSRKHKTALLYCKNWIHPIYRQKSTSATRLSP